jgi:dienelactone hydrolase
VESWRGAIRSTFHISEPHPELASDSHGRFEIEPGVTVERVSYGTQFGMRIPALLYLPEKRAGRIPAVIVVNGHGGDKYSWYAFYSGILYARSGAAVLTYDPTGEGERNAHRRSGTRAHDVKEEPPELARRLCGLMITDLMQAVSYLSQRPEVDAGRIAACGYSLGSFVVGMTGAIDPRIRACVMAGGGNFDGPGEYWDKTKPMCTGQPYRSLLPMGDRPAILYALHAARGPALVFNGTKDGTVGIRIDQEEIFQNLRGRVAALRGGNPEGLFEWGFEPGAGHRPWFVTRPVALWLERTLDLPAWTESDIRAMPETHISEWVKARKADIDPLYADEHQEGGTMALGSGVPRPSRDDLCVFTAEAWEREKDRLVHEKWREHARDAIRKSLR